MTSHLLAVAWVLAATGRDPAVEQGVEARLEKSAPAAVPAFTGATRALDEGRMEDAAKGYREVSAAAPEFDVAHRRLCAALTGLKRFDEALPECEKAVALDASSDNEFTLAELLLQRSLPPDARRFSGLVEHALSTQPKGSRSWLDWKALDCMHLAKLQSPGAAGCTRELLAASPMDPVANYLAVPAAAMDGDWDVARARLERARPILSPEEYARMAGLLDDNEPLTSRFGLKALEVVGAWAAALGLLVALGLLLSRLTLRTAHGLSTVRDEHAAGGARALRSLYKTIVGFGAVYYYLSLPIVVAAVVLVGGGLIYACFALGRIPVKLVAIIGVMVLATLWAVLKSLFVRAKDEDPGEKLEWATAPKLRRLLDGVAAKVGTRPVDSVYLTPGTDVAVFERGGLRKRWANQSERCLILGVGVLDGFQLQPFRSVLAHEHGHFSNQDTAGGDLALWARRSLFTMGLALAQGGAAAWYNPAWLFFRGYFAVFMRITQGASRLQEVLADRRAIFSYGSAAFRDGYHHVIRRSVAFDAHASATLQEVIQQKKGLSNLYRFAPSTPPSDKDLDEAFEKALGREPSALDSHPSSKDRLAWAAALAIPGKDEADAADEVWSLFESREALERQMTTVVRTNVAVNHQLVIAEAGETTTAAGESTSAAEAAGAPGADPSAAPGAQ